MSLTLLMWQRGRVSFIAAVGSSSTLGYHKYRGNITLDLTTSTQTPAPTVAPAPPTPEPSSPPFSDCKCCSAFCSLATEVDGLTVEFIWKVDLDDDTLWMDLVAPGDVWCVHTLLGYSAQLPSAFPDLFPHPSVVLPLCLVYICRWCTSGLCGNGLCVG